MRLFSEIEKALGKLEDSSRILYTVLDGGGGYFQNVKKIFEFSGNAIVFCGKKGKVRIEGENLSLGKYDSGDAVVRGKIERVEQCD